MTLLQTGIIFFTLIFVSCNSPNEKNQKMEITIEYSDSYKYDLSRKMYSVFFMNQNEIKTPFSLSNLDEREINETLSRLNIEDFIADTTKRRRIIIEDNCQVLPKPMTILKFKSSGKSLTIEIDQYCESFKSNNLINPNDIKNFIEVTTKTIDAKPQIKGALKSDIFYE